MAEELAKAYIRTIVRTTHDKEPAKVGQPNRFRAKQVAPIKKQMEAEVENVSRDCRRYGLPVGIAGCITIKCSGSAKL